MLKGIVKDLWLLNSRKGGTLPSYIRIILPNILLVKYIDFLRNATPPFELKEILRIDFENLILK